MHLPRHTAAINIRDVPVSQLWCPLKTSHQEKNKKTDGFYCPVMLQIISTAEYYLHIVSPDKRPRPASTKANVSCEEQTSLKGTVVPVLWSSRFIMQTLTHTLRYSREASVLLACTPCLSSLSLVSMATRRLTPQHIDETG